MPLRYYAFGSPMPGRNFIGSNTYRYGFNDKENDNEVDGEGNTMDFGSRMEDTRIGRWFSRDPQANRYNFISPYAAFGNSPLYYSDAGGETLKVVIDGNINKYNDEVDDIRSLLPDNKRNTLIKVETDGTIKFTVPLEEAKALAATDPGIALVYFLVTAEEKILYEVSEFSNGALPSGEERMLSLFAPFGGRNNYQVDNLSTTLKYPLGDERNKEHSRSPLEAGIDGKVVIDPYLSFITQSTLIDDPKSRDAIVFHELAENYFRTVKKMNYDQAHEMANKVQDFLQEVDRRRDGISGKAHILDPPSGDVIQPKHLQRGRYGKNDKSKPARATKGQSHWNTRFFAE